MVVYDHYESKSKMILLPELKEKIIPKWKENIGIIKTSGQTALEDAVGIDFFALRLRCCFEHPVKLKCAHVKCPIHNLCFLSK